MLDDLMEKLEYIFIDLDGTLLEGKYKHYNCYKDIINEDGGIALDIDTYWNMKRNRVTQDLCLKKSYYKSTYNNFLKKWIENIEKKKYLDYDNLKPEVIKTLNEWKMYADKLILITMRNNEENLYWQLDKLKIKDLFHDVIICKCIDNRNKYEFIQDYKINRAVVVGDTEQDIKLSVLCKIKCIAITNGIRDKKFLESDFYAEEIKNINMKDVIKKIYNKEIKDMTKELAIKGGKPVRDTYLSYGKQWIGQDDIDSVVNVLKSDYLTTGPFVREFENRVAEYVGAKYAVTVSNGTAALHMACYAAGIKEGDEVIVSPITFAASANCVLYCNGTPVFADIDPNTYNIDVKEIEKKITNRTKAIIPVDFTGQAVDIDAIKSIADKYNLTIIEDAAHALGSEYKGKKVGTLSHMTEFSFHPVKPITTGEGGVVTTDDENLYKKMSLFRTHCITRDSELLTQNEGPWYYEQIDLGYNYRITDLQSALGISQVKKLDEFINRRREIVKAYNEAFKDVEEIITPYEAEYSNSGWHIYIIKLRLDKLKCTRKEIFEALQAENIGVNVHYLPVYLHPYYQRLGYRKGLCPVAEKLYDSMITIPLFPKMTNQDINDVISAVKKVINYYKNA